MYIGCPFFVRTLIQDSIIDLGKETISERGELGSISTLAYSRPLAQIIISFHFSLVGHLYLLRGVYWCKKSWNAIRGYKRYKTSEKVIKFTDKIPSFVFEVQNENWKVWFN